MLRLWQKQFDETLNFRQNFVQNSKLSILRNFEGVSSGQRWKIQKKEKAKHKTGNFPTKTHESFLTTVFFIFPKGLLSLSPSLLLLSLSLPRSLGPLSLQPPGYLICSYSNCSCSGEIALIHTIPPILSTECTVVNTKSSFVKCILKSCPIYV